MGLRLILGQKSLIHLLKKIEWLNRALFACLLSTLLFTIYGIFFPFKKNLSKKMHFNEIERILPASLADTEAGTAPLALSSDTGRFPFPELKEKIRLLAKNTRPDAVSSSLKYEIALEGNPQSVRVLCGTTLYLVYDQKGLHFSREKTPLWVRPSLGAKGEDLLELGIELTSETGEVEFCVTQQCAGNRIWKTKQIEEVDCLDLREGGKLLRDGKWWGPDQFFERYGGETFQKCKGKQRLAILKHRGDKILYVQEGETFIWRGGRWERSSETQGFLMAKVLACDFEKMEWQLWDKKGIESVRLSFSKEETLEPPLDPQKIFKNVKQKGLGQISCKIGKQSLLLREGDWLVHLSHGWRVVKNLREMEALLDFQLKGDLFIFDRIERVGEKGWLSGTLFNKARAKAQDVKLLIPQMERVKHSSHLKNPSFTKISE